MKTIDSIDDLFNAELYLPQVEKEWVDIYFALTGLFDFRSSFITVGQTAELITERKFSNSLTQRVQYFLDQFDYSKYTVEACPSRFITSARIYLRDGNRRSIAYAIKLIGGEVFQPVPISHWLDYFERRDTRDLGQ